MTMTVQEGNDLILRSLFNPLPFMAARLGALEFCCISCYLSMGWWPENLKDKVRNNAGFFPTDDESLSNFCETMIKHIPSADLMATWLDEENFLYEHNKNLQLSGLRCLEPYYYSNPWSQALEGKRVLVIHPFENSIKKQYEKRSLIFGNGKILPEFRLLTIKAVQSMAGMKTEFSTWFEALDSMRSKISEADFDIALVGAGSYGFPLAGFIKSLGKKVVHMGGALQILFGIKGVRWESHEHISTLFNEHWVRPSKEETPENHLSIENGCYW